MFSECADCVMTAQPWSWPQGRTALLDGHWPGGGVVAGWLLELAHLSSSSWSPPLWPVGQVGCCPGSHCEPAAGDAGGESWDPVMLQEEVDALGRQFLLEDAGTGR